MEKMCMNMKGIKFTIFTLVMAFSIAMGFYGNSASAAEVHDHSVDPASAVEVHDHSVDSASTAEAHDYYDRLDYKSEKLSVHQAYTVNDKLVNCTISQWYVRSIQNCRLHPGEANISPWGGHSLVHSHAHR